MRGAFIVFCILCLVLTGCSSLYKYEENMAKLDTKDNQVKFPAPAPDLQHVEEQKLSGIPDSFMLDGGFDEFLSFGIVKDAKITNNELDVDFIIKEMNEGKAKEISTEKIIWSNGLFLLYTIVDTFPEVEEIKLHSNYYYQDKYGNPYSETVFIANTSKKVIKKINREYFRPDMLKDLIDFYMSNSVTDGNE